MSEKMNFGSKDKSPEELLRDVEFIAENSIDAILSETLDGIIMSWNKGAENMFGYTAEEVIGKSIVLLLPSDVKDEFLILLDKVKAGEYITSHDSLKMRKDGSRIYTNHSLSPIKMHDGTVIGASIVERDITERKKMEESLRQIEAVVNNSNDAIIGSSTEGIIKNWNPGAEKILGYAPEEIIGKSFLIAAVPGLEKKAQEIFMSVVEGKKRITDDNWRIKRKDGSILEVALSVSPILSDNRSVVGVSTIITDNSARKKDERRISELSELRNKFISIVSHQLRTPLTAINWNLEMLLSGDFGKMEDTQKKFLQVTHSASVEITRRIHNLLTAIDIEEGRVIYEKVEVALNRLCADVVSEIFKNCETKNLVCAYAPLPADLPVFNGDAGKIRKIVEVLMENALAYTKEGGRVDASLKLNGDIARFEVVDTGIGIPQEDQHLIFNRFFRASNAASMQADAFGLGLYLAKNFIEQHGGKIGFESKAGAGSKFWFEIPVK